MNEADAADGSDGVNIEVEWLTIAEAADRFAVPIRSLRRAVEKHQNEATNGAHDRAQTRQVTRRTKTGERTAAVFPVAFLERLAGEIKVAAGAGEQIPTPPANESQNGAANRAEPSANGAVQGDAPHTAPFDGAGHDGAFVAHLQAENARLWAALEQAQANVKAEQENTQAALAQLAEARRESQVLIAATAAGRLHLTATQQAEPMQSNEASNEAEAGLPIDGSHGAVSRERESTGGDLRPDAAETGPSADGLETAPDTAQRGKWWQIWKR